MRSSLFLRRAHAANTLVELILYMALTLIIIVGLTNIVSRLKQAELSGTVKTDVQQSVRATIQQFTGLAQLYESGSIIMKTHLPAPAGEAGSGVLLWNAVQNQNMNPGELPRNYLRFWLEEGVVYTQSYMNNQGQSTRVPVTPEGILVSTLEFRDVSGDSNDAVLSIHIIAEDNSPSENIRDQFQWNISSAVTLRPKNELADFCCPSYLNFCPVGFPLCENNGCFAVGQSGSDLLGHFTAIVNDEVIVNFKNSRTNNSPDLPAAALTTNDGGFNSPQGLALDEVGNRLFVTDGNNNRVLQFDLNEDNTIANYNASAVFGQPNFTQGTPPPILPASDSRIRTPRGLAYNKMTNQLFVVDTGYNRVLGFNLDDAQDNPSHLYNADIVIGQPDFLSRAAAVTVTGLSTPYDIEFDYALKRAYIADHFNNRILIYRLNDEYEFIGTQNIPADGILGQTSFTSNSADATEALDKMKPGGLAVGPTHLFVSDYNSNSSKRRVIAFNHDDIIFPPDPGSPPFPAIYAEFVVAKNNALLPESRVNDPLALAYNPINNKLFIADFSAPGSRVLAFSGTTPGLRTTPPMSSINVLGNPSFTVATTSPATQWELQSPMAMEYDSTHHRLFVADSAQHKVMVFDAGGPECNNAEYFEPPAGAQMSVASSTSSSYQFNFSCDADPECAGQDWDNCNLYKSIDDEFILTGSSPNQTYQTNTDDFVRACDGSSSFFTLSDTPASFEENDDVENVLLRVHYSMNAGLTGGPNPTGFKIGLYENPSAPTPITSATVVSSSSDTGWRSWQTELPFTGPANNKETWNDAVVRIENLNLPDGLPYVVISAIEVEIDYGHTENAILRPNGDVVSATPWTRIGDPPSFNPNMWGGLSLWLLAGSGTLNGAAEATDGQAVSAWLDRKASGTGYNAVQATGTKQPILVENAINNLPAVSFDGFDDVLSTSQMANQFVGGYSYFYVLSLDDGRPAVPKAPFGNYFPGIPPKSYYHVVLQESGSVLLTTTAASPFAQRLGVLSDGPTPYYLFSATAAQNGASFDITGYLNGQASIDAPRSLSTAQWTSIKNTTTETQHFGNARNPTPSTFTGVKIAEVIIYNRGLTSTERCAVQSYLDTKYNLGLTPCS